MSRTNNSTPTYPPPRLTNLLPYDFFFGIDDDITSSLTHNFQAIQATRTGASDSRRPFEGAQANPGTRQMMSNQWNTAASPPREADSRLSYNEQKKALQKLKKEIYNPFRRITKTVNLYYRNTAVKANEMGNEENGKRCAICLEDFEPKQEVMITPCKHMFHEECIVPWVKSNGRCPVCRFAICE